MKKYEFLLLSSLLKKSRENLHPDYADSLNYIKKRLEGISSSPSSEFNKKIKLFTKFIPVSFLVKILYRFGYDAMIGFCEENEVRTVYGMLSFQKHHSKGFIGMFDVFISQDRRGDELIANFRKISEMVYNLSKSFSGDYKYIQCGKNEATRKLLELYKRFCKRNMWDSKVDVENSRILLS